VGGSGIEVGTRMRYTAGFPMNSGVYVGEIESYTVFDVNAAYEIPGWDGFRTALSVNNVLDHRHREFIGAPEKGLIAILQLTYELGPG